eukprot:GSChrysophyteH1.ASY1.ANO1.2910.1 assembled CDS
MVTLALSRVFIVLVTLTFAIFIDCKGSNPRFLNSRVLTVSMTSDIKLNGVEHARSVHAADVDNDGNIDVLSASYEDNTIAWYESDGASSPSFTKHVISSNANGAVSVYAADINSDGTVDVLSASLDDDRIVWYENDGNSPPAWTSHTITADALNARSVFAIDLDGDGDMDVISASSQGNTIAWYEQTLGFAPTPAPSQPGDERVIDDDAARAYHVFACDVNGDGNVDVLSASFGDDTISWYQNDGDTPAGFIRRPIDKEAHRVRQVYAKDLDGDGDVDVLSACEDDSSIFWYENGGGGSPSWTKHVVDSNAKGAFSVYATDMDNDGYVDILSASAQDNIVAWYENDRAKNGATYPTFVKQIVAEDAEYVVQVYAVDLNHDGHMDLLSAAAVSGSINIYESEGPQPSSLPTGQPTSQPSAPTFAPTEAEAEVQLEASPEVILTLVFCAAIFGGAGMYMKKKYGNKTPGKVIAGSEEDPETGESDVIDFTEVAKHGEASAVPAPARAAPGEIDPTSAQVECDEGDSMTADSTHGSTGNKDSGGGDTPQALDPVRSAVEGDGINETLELEVHHPEPDYGLAPLYVPKIIYKEMWRPPKKEEEKDEEEEEKGEGPKTGESDAAKSGDGEPSAAPTP